MKKKQKQRIQKNNIIIGLYYNNYSKRFGKYDRIKAREYLADMGIDTRKMSIQERATKKLKLLVSNSIR